MATTFTAMQVYDALIRQGFPEDTALAMSEAVGSSRKTQKELQRGYQALGAKGVKQPSGDDGGLDSNLMNNIGEGALATYGAYKIPQAVIAPRPQLDPDASFTAKAKNRLGHAGKNSFGYLKNAGRFGALGVLGTLGNYAGSALTGSNYNDRASMPQLLADIGGSIGGGMLAGRLLGGAAGSIVPGIGTVVGSALGGWLLPKLLPGPKSVKEEKGRYRSPLN